MIYQRDKTMLSMLFEMLRTLWLSKIRKKNHMYAQSRFICEDNLLSPTPNSTPYRVSVGVK